MSLHPPSPPTPNRPGLEVSSQVDSEARTQQELLPLQQPPTPHPLRSTTPSDSRVLAAAAAANMVHIDEAVKLDFKDVLIRPKRSTLKSRSQVRCVGTLCWGSGLWVR